MRIDIPAALRDLTRIVDQIAENLEWRRLAQQEHRHPFPTSFDLDEHLDDEMRDLQVCFADADFSLRELLRRPDLDASEEQRQAWMRELERLENRVAALSVSVRFINP